MPLESAAHWILGRVGFSYYIPSSSMVSATQPLSIYLALEGGHGTVQQGLAKPG